MTTNSLTALITGGTSGIGRAAANKLAQLGIHVIVVGRNAERGEKTVAEIRAAGGEADFISTDLRDASSAREVARRAVELGTGHVDILINNAGIFPFGPTHETTEEVFESVYSLNVKAPNGKIPALLIRISTWPFPSSTALLATSRALDASRRSDDIKSASPPAARISATVFSPRSALRPTTMTWMPSWASLLAAARPIPLVPPVISAVNELVVICNFP